MVAERLLDSQLGRQSVPCPVMQITNTCVVFGGHSSMWAFPHREVLLILNKQINTLLCHIMFSENQALLTEHIAIRKEAQREAD